MSRGTWGEKGGDDKEDGTALRQAQGTAPAEDIRGTGLPQRLRAASQRHHFFGTVCNRSLRTLSINYFPFPIFNIAQHCRTLPDFS